jgi:hypothetical protein
MDTYFDTYATTHVHVNTFKQIHMDETIDIYIYVWTVFQLSIEGFQYSWVNSDVGNSVFFIFLFLPQYKHLKSDQTLRITNLISEIRDSECLVRLNVWSD